MLRYAAIAVAAASGGCWIVPERPVFLEGQRAQYICLSTTRNGTCLRSEWRCTMPLQLTWDYDGNPRCVVPGAR